MNIYTSYFGRLNKIPDHVVPISICGKAPDWYTGLQYKKLAPKLGFFMEWKKNHDNDFYIGQYYEEVLSKLNRELVLTELAELSSGKDVVLICYEKTGDFCHRHLVAAWLELEVPFRISEI